MLTKMLSHTPHQKKEILHTICFISVNTMHHI